MLVRWWRRREAGWRRGLAINGLGALTTAVVALVVGSSNFFQGSWLVIVLVPILMALLHGDPRPLPRHGPRPGPGSHPGTAGGRAQADRDRADRPPRPSRAPGDRLRQLDQHRGRGGARHARPGNGRCAPRALAGSGPGRPSWWWSSRRIGRSSVRCWPTWTRSSARPRIGRSWSSSPSSCRKHWWENLLHNQTALRLKLRLFSRRNTIVADVPYHPHD